MRSLFIRLSLLALLGCGKGPLFENSIRSLPQQVQSVTADQPSTSEGQDAKAVNPKPTEANDLPIASPNSDPAEGSPDFSVPSMTTGAYLVSCQWLVDGSSFACKAHDSTTKERLPNRQEITWSLANDRGEPLPLSDYVLTRYGSQEPWDVMLSINSKETAWQLQVSIPTSAGRDADTVLIKRSDIAPPPGPQTDKTEHPLNLHVGDATWTEASDASCLKDYELYPPLAAPVAVQLDIAPQATVQALTLSGICGLSNQGATISIVKGKDEVLVARMALQNGDMAFDSMNLAPGTYYLLIESKSDDNFFFKSLLTTQSGGVAVKIIH